MKLKTEITEKKLTKEVSQFRCMKSGCAFYTGCGKQRRLRYVIEIYSTNSSLSPEGGYSGNS